MNARYISSAITIVSLCVASAGAQQQAQQQAPQEAKRPYVEIGQKTVDALLLTRVEPDYPDAVKATQMSGQIVIGFTIGKDGEASNVRPLDVGLFGCRSMNGDNPALQQAAVAAVKQWKFRPFLMHDQPGDAGTPVDAAAAVALPFDFHATSTVAPSAGMAVSTPPASCDPRKKATPQEYVQPKVDLNKPVFGALVIEPSQAEEMLAHKVDATYPPTALMNRTQGNVILQVLIDKGGHVAKMKAMSGHPAFIQPSMDAVKQWEYRPFLLNGEPVEVETAVVVKFRM
ncbi:MAG TPA: energy transducer TonB [Candidatus Angelobacter sp.]|jgi:TonB family protein